MPQIQPHKQGALGPFWPWEALSPMVPGSKRKVWTRTQKAWGPILTHCLEQPGLGQRTAHPRASGTSPQGAAGRITGPGAQRPGAGPGASQLSEKQQESLPDV